MKLTTKQLRRIIKEELNKINESDFGGEQMALKKFMVLVGPPSVGKSTWIQNNLPDDVYVINRDDIVEAVAEDYNWTYDDMFAAPPQDAQVGDFDEKYGKVVQSPSYMSWQPLSFDKILEANGIVFNEFNQRVAGAVPSSKDIVVDMTNMNARARSGAMRAVQGHENRYEKIAVVFETEGAEEFIKKVAAKRAAAAKRMGKSKTIPPHVFDRMFSSFQKVEPSEGFDKIVSVDNRQFLRQMGGERNFGHDY
jgi:hypothetical protein